MPGVLGPQEHIENHKGTLECLWTPVMGTFLSDMVITTESYHCICLCCHSEHKVPPFLEIPEASCMVLI